MLSVFYDLETSTRHFVGEILNYCFILCDDQLKPLETFKGIIRLSRLEIPDPGAILANKIDLMEHQASAKLLERQALPNILEFLSKCLKLAKGKELPLIGYNSSKFDLPFLRTALIRNGLNPYISNKLISRDLRFVVRKLAIDNLNFPQSSDDCKTLSLRMETVTRALGLLQGAQSHESHQDVLLTIKLAAYCKEQLNLDVRTYCPFELDRIETLPGQIFELREPVYDLQLNTRQQIRPLLLLDRDNSSSLWVDIEKFEAGSAKQSIFWFHRLNSHFVSGERLQKIEHKSRPILEAFKDIKLANYFQRSTCDIEQDIYRLDYDARNALTKALWDRDISDLRKLNSDDANQIYRRHALKHYVWGGDRDDKVREYLLSYACYRYATTPGVDRMRLSKRGDHSLHPSLEDFMSQASQTDKQHGLLASWLEYCKSSDIAPLLAKSGLNSSAALARVG